jgi:hypothetical protein
MELHCAEKERRSFHRKTGDRHTKQEIQTTKISACGCQKRDRLNINEYCISN